jgi:hypothetical protein
MAALEDGTKEHTVADIQAGHLLSLLTHYVVRHLIYLFSKQYSYRCK